MGPNQAPTSPGDWGPDRGGFVAEALNLHRIDLDSLKGRLTLSPMPAATYQIR